MLSRRALKWIGIAAVPVVVAGIATAGDSTAQVETSLATSTTSTTSTASTTTTGFTASTTSPTSIRSTTSTGIVSTTLFQSVTTTSAATTSLTTGTAPAPLPPGWSSALVVSVVDGDTIHVRLEDGSIESLRLIGTNSPETGECYATEATKGLRSLIGGETVHLEPDVSDRDQYGRLLRYVWTMDDRFVNATTVENGWAIAREYPPDTSRTQELEAAQERAQDAAAGLWAPDACGTPVPAHIRIDYIEYDAPGNDGINLNGEWVELNNADDVVVDLTGWVLKDESASHRYSFPNGFSIQPGVTVRVFTGCGEDTSTEVYWCMSGSAVWNNSGDTAFLLDPAGNIVHSYAYG